MKRTYTDRLDNNKRKTLDPRNEFAVAFAFQVYKVYTANNGL